LNYFDALEKVYQLAGAINLETESISLTESLGRVLSESVSCSENVPAFDNSAVDGFAFRPEQVAKIHGFRTLSSDPPLYFPVLGTLAAGDVPPEYSPDGGVWQIMTGAALPTGFDSCAKIEDCDTVCDAPGSIEKVSVKKIDQRENLRPAGSDFSVGNLLAVKGTEIETEHLAALAAVGIAHVPVYRKIKVALLATGREIVSGTQPLETGQVRNATSPLLMSFFSSLGCDVKNYGQVGDDPALGFARLIEIVTDKPDVIVTTGAVSMGVHDFIPALVRDLGGDIFFHRVEMRPGKPVLFARLRDEGPAFFGLPGNPVSTLVGTRFFIEPFLRRIRGQDPELRGRAKLTREVAVPSRLTCFLKGHLDFGESLRVAPLAGQASFMVRPLLNTNAWIVIPEGSRNTKKDDEVIVLPFLSFRGFQCRTL
jgi:molybdopterin molybdotransferase